MRLTGPGSVIVVAAIGAATIRPPAWGLRAYGDRAYPAMQAIVTPLSNRVSVPMFDLLLVGVVSLLAVAAVISLRRARRGRTIRPLLRLAGATLVLAALVYLWFLAAWGYNYRRHGVETLIAAYEPNRATPALVRTLAERAVERTNRLHASAHASGFPALADRPAALVDSWHAVERRLGRPRPTAPSTPKRPWTAGYMRAVGVSGMLAPLFLETYLNPDLTGPERPYVLAHEWAHLSGFAPEEDASFVGLLAALGADAPAQYSAWLFLVSEAAARLHPVTRDLVLSGLAEGPRADLMAIARRLEARVPWLDRASWVAYDRAIKSQGAEAGVAGYGRVIDLVLGSGALATEGLSP